jgi:phage-related minor tail protein
MIAQIDQLATEYVEAASGVDQIRDRLEAAQDAQEEFRDNIKDTFKDLITGAEDAREVIGRLIGRIADLALESALSGLFEAGGASQSGGGSLLGTIGSWFGYAGGGYTGDGGKYEPAGIVHKGEYVVQADQVRKPGMLAALSAINNGLPGFAQGGLVPGAEGSKELIIRRRA